MLKAKITTVGSSAGITLPKEVMHKLKVAKGDYLYVIETPHGYELTPYNEQFIKQMEIAQRVMREDRNVLKALAHDSQIEPHIKNN